MPSQQVPRHVVEFDTALVEPRLRIPLWEEFNRRWMSTVRCRTLTPDNLQTRVRCTEFSGVAVSELWGQGHFVERSREHILAGNADEVYLLVLLEGEGHVVHAHGADRLTAGDALVYDASVPSVFSLLGDFHEVALRVRKDSVAGLAAVDSRAPVVIRGAERGPLVERVRAATRTAQAALRCPPDAPEDAAREIRDLFGLVLGSRTGSLDAYWLTAKEHIRRNLHDPGLDVTQVSRAVGLSSRHLARVFAEHDCTVAQHILLARLERARALLLDPAHSSRSIAEIGRRAGFSSASQFSRAFRRAYGTSAREARRDTGPGMRPGAPSRPVPAPVPALVPASAPGAEPAVQRAGARAGAPA